MNKVYFNSLSSWMQTFFCTFKNMYFIKRKFDELTFYNNETDFFKGNLKIYQNVGLSIWPSDKKFSEAYRYLVYISFLLILYPLFFWGIYDLTVNYNLETFIETLTTQLHHFVGMWRYMNMVRQKWVEVYTDYK